ncbi:MAG: hypothetical protein KME01_16335 [Chroococcus sp. CMT-3BRIN-NPC107]|jgi:hypothetical protein|nr:hypothetical protein [Chroococcus sp. CMT-3BRIN-NPC107]
MVERPIKKSERQVAPPSDAVEQTQEPQPTTVNESLEATTILPEKRKVLPSIPGKEKAKGRGRGSNREEAAAPPPMNLALMRGPKPTKSKPPVVEAPPEEVESSEPPLDVEDANPDSQE